MTIPPAILRLKQSQSSSRALVKEPCNFFQSLFNVENHFVIRFLHKVKKHKIDPKKHKNRQYIGIFLQ